MNYFVENPYTATAAIIKVFDIVLDYRRSENEEIGELTEKLK